jgi:isopenicillin-N N-acyltransferase-like protein
VTPPPVPLVRAAGSHAYAGAQVGAATAETIRAAVDGLALDSVLVERYRAATLEHLPWVVEELDAAASAAGVDPLALFGASIEELEPAEAPAACSDLVLTGARTADGHLLVAHNNDLYAEDEDGVVAIEWRVPGEPAVFTLGVGPWISVGWNEAGLSVTGNELAPNDERVGIPRLLQMRDVLVRRTLPEAVDAVLHPARASSYNWVLAHRDGGALNVEGSATAAGIDEPGEEGFLAHTNHYARADMVEFERPGPAGDSGRRLARARELALASTAATPASLREALAEHDALCRHGGGGPKDVKTVFWCVADVTAGEIHFGRGNPCDSEAQVYRFGA